MKMKSHHPTTAEDRILPRTEKHNIFRDKYMYLKSLHDLYSPSKEQSQLTAGEDEVTFMFVQRELSELHGLANHRDVAPGTDRKLKEKKHRLPIPS